MAFLRIEGLDIDTLVDSFQIKDVSVEDYARASDDSLQGCTYAVKRELELETPPMTAADARALELWIRGRKHLWTFDRVDSATTRFTRFSADGGLALATSAVTGSSLSLFGSYALQLNASSVTATATAMFGSEGDWSVSLYHHPVTTTTYTSYAVRSRGGAIQAFASGASTGTLGFLNATAASGFLQVTLSGRTFVAGTAGLTNTASFDQLAIYPYALTDQMVLTLATPTLVGPQGGAPPPYVTVVGDALQVADVNATDTGEAGPIRCKGFVESMTVEPVVLNGSFAYNSRQLRVRLTQR